MLKQTIQHNQSVFVAAAICVILFGGFLACHLTPAQQSQAISGAAQIAQGVVSGTPIPWDKIGLLIGTIIGAGAIVDNRRKDVAIKMEQKYSNAKTELLAKLVDGNSTNPPK